MKPVQSLPSTYHSIGTLDITKDRRALIFMNFVGVLMLVLTGWFFAWAITRLRGNEFAGRTLNFQVSGLWDVLVLLLAVLVLTAFYVTFHEVIHGVFFWWSTRSRPQFAFRWTHAYAAAPDWYLPRNAYLMTSLAPLVVISLVGLALIPLLPADWLVAAWFVLTMNASGSVGDILVAGWLLRQPVTCLAQDRGDSVTLYVSR